VKVGKKKRGNQNQRGVLSDHRRQGKRFIPPLLDLPVKVDTYWRDLSIPELVWIGLLIQRYGLRDGADFAATLAKGAAEIWHGEKKKWFAKASNYAALSADQHKSLIATTPIADQLESYQFALGPLNRWYPDSPLAFIGIGDETNADLTVIKDLLAQMYDKTGTLPMQIQTTAIYLGFVTGTLFIRKGMILGELELINEYPVTDRSQQFGASVRASIGALIQGPDGTDRAWANAFWQRGFALESCLFPESGNE
jgi:hypothetical protein